MSDRENPTVSRNPFSLSNLNTKTKIMMVAAVPLIFTIGIAVIASLNLGRMSETSRWVNHTHAVMEEADTIVAAAVDMESSMRGYLLAGKETFLESYQNGVTGVYSDFARLREIVSNDPAQIARLTEAEHILVQWQVEVAERQIELRRAIVVAPNMHTRANAKTMDDMADLVGQGRGKIIFAQFREIMTAFTAEEERLIELRIAENELSVQTAKPSILAAVAAAILIGSGFAWLIGSRNAKAIKAITASMGRLTDGDIAFPIKGQNRRDEIGAMAKALAVFRESILREQALETEVKDRARMMAALLEGLPDNFVRLDKNGTILDFTVRIEPSLVKDPATYIGRDFADILPPEARALFEENMRKQQATQGVVTWEYHLEVEGKRRDREARLCPIAGSDETALMVRDISMRCQAESDRAFAEARLDQIITSLPGAIISRRITKSEGEAIIYVSPQSADIWGYTPKEIYATKGVLETTVDPIHLREIRQIWVKAVETPEPYSSRYPIINRSGEPKWLETNTNVFAQEDGGILTVGFISDVTAEVVAQQQLEAQKAIADRAQKLESIGQLTGGVAHDFNNLLAAILGSLELLRDDETDAEQLSLIDTGIRATQRGAELTRNMLAFARRASLEPSVIELNTLVNETCNWAGRALPSKIEVETSLLAGLWPIKVDISSTESSLLNLILNARDAMPEGGKLTIETANVRVDRAYLDVHHEKMEPGRYVLLAVSDTGHGIPDETIEHIFEPFFSTKAPGAGTGLGLSMIMGFMQQSGGTVQLTSEADVGTTFRLYFKAFTGEAKTRVVEPSQSESPKGGGQQILVAEDQDNVRSILIKTLEKAGYDVTAVGTGDEALAQFEVNPTFDLLLTDIVMPGSLQGPALSQAIRKQAPDLPVVFMSGYANEATVHRNGLQPEDIRLNKPVMRADLLAAIKRSLGG
ncbi:hypothetical protein A9Q94_11885 [Rhodobacterales bacterium 56_14_T64]|nr:hypothetical protein A9Q94_11885 [Rhodobacterales bacterium 56_14_T64]